MPPKFPHLLRIYTFPAWQITARSQESVVEVLLLLNPDSLVHMLALGNRVFPKIGCSTRFFTDEKREGFERPRVRLRASDRVGRDAKLANATAFTVQKLYFEGCRFSHGVARRNRPDRPHV